MYRDVTMVEVQKVLDLWREGVPTLQPTDFADEDSREAHPKLSGTLDHDLRG
jgi:hypothetical protein